MDACGVCIFIRSTECCYIHIGAGYVVILVVQVYQNLSEENDDCGLRFLCYSVNSYA